MYRSLVIICISLFSIRISGYKYASVPLSKNIFRLKSSLSSDEQIVHQLFIGNLPFSLDESSLRSMLDERLSDVSPYKSLRLQTDKVTGKSRGFGYIHFGDKDAAEQALNALNGFQVDGRDVKVDMSEPRVDKPRAMIRTPTENSVFIGNLGFSVSEQSILNLCNDVLGEGLAQKVRLVSDRETGRPRGFGHVDFANADDANRAIDLLNGIELEGRSIRVDKARGKDSPPVSPSTSTRRPMSGGSSMGSSAPSHSVFIGNLAWDLNQQIVEEMLQDILGPDSYSRVRLAVDKETGRPRGFGHIDFKDKELAERAVVELNGLEVMGRSLRADHAERKDAKQF